MPRDILDEVQRLRTDRQPFALATVVAANQPTSGTPGARAVVLPDATLHGWIGGHCAQPAVIQHSLEALRDGQPRLVIISPDALEQLPKKNGVIPVAMTCAGQGELQIFIEPFLPKIALVVIGASPVARALSQLATLLDFTIWACGPDASMETFPDANQLIPSLDALKPQLTASTFVIVATFGDYDEAAVQMALESDAGYVGIVASQKRLAAIRGYLEDRGLSKEQLARLKRPKGLKGHALLPAEIALSVVAELVEVRRAQAGVAPETVPSPRETAIDPICGMTVDIATAVYKTERNGKMYYFCCAGCQTQFEKVGV
ncbi:MAG TPA: XdhC family protein [Ktedonobacterales bacterium]|jgi:xanthine dehydrogenase accessory factor